MYFIHVHDCTCSRVSSMITVPQYSQNNIHLEINFHGLICPLHVLIGNFFFIPHTNFCPLFNVHIKPIICMMISTTVFFVLFCFVFCLVFSDAHLNMVPPQPATLPPSIWRHPKNSVRWLVSNSVSDWLRGDPTVIIRWSQHNIISYEYEQLNCNSCFSLAVNNHYLFWEKACFFFMNNAK